MAELKAARLRRVNGILTAASAFFAARLGPARHGVDGRLRRRVQGPFQGRAGLRGAGPRVLGAHAGSFMAVYGCRKTRARSSARDRDPAGIGRGRVTDVMRESGIRGVRRGGTPVTARPARGAGGGPGLAERGFEAGGGRTGRRWPASPACAWPTARSAARRSPPTVYVQWF